VGLIEVLFDPETGGTELATYERTDYRYHYRCKECAHRWTGTGSSERRIS